MNGNHYGVNDWTWVARHGDLNLDQQLGWFWVIPRTTRSWRGKNGPPGNPGFFISCPPVVGIRPCAFGGNTVAISRGKTPNSLIESSRLVGRGLRWGDADWQSWLQPACVAPPRALSQVDHQDGHQSTLGNRLESTAHCCGFCSLMFLEDFCLFVFVLKLFFPETM